MFKQRSLKQFITPPYLALFAAAAALMFTISPMQAQDSAKAMSTDTAKTQATKVATLAGGCFWCTEADLEKAPGVITAISGYSGGSKATATYEQTSAGGTKHIETVQVHYDPSLISYAELLEYFWRNIDPTDNGGQFVDRGAQYRPAIFYHNAEQKAAAEAGFKELAKKFDKPIVVDLLEYKSFYPAEDYHQDYYKEHAIKYKYYRQRSGRDDFLDKHWQSKPEHFKKFKKPTAAKLKQQLDPIAYEVTQDDGTEKPFDNPYWDNKAAGIYVDVITGEALFSSTDKFKSGTGWPSFTKPIVSEYVVEKADWSLFTPRTEVRSKYADSHLGHVFEDGPGENGLRYCVNSAAMRFIPKDKLEAQGYGNYSYLFK